MVTGWCRAESEMQDQLCSTHTTSQTSLCCKLWKCKIASDSSRGRSSGPINPLNLWQAHCGGDVNVAGMSPLRDTHVVLPWPPTLWRLPVDPWRHSSGMTVLLCFLIILMGSLFCRSSNLGCFDAYSLSSYTSQVLFLSSFVLIFLLSIFFLSFLASPLTPPPCCDFFLQFLYLFPPFLSSLFSLHSFPSASWFCFPVALTLIGEDKVSLWTCASVSWIPLQQRGDTRVQLLSVFLLWFCLLNFIWIFFVFVISCFIRQWGW